jgi:hypothetical protein
MPGPLAELGRHPFSFYPAIVGVGHNEWILGRVTWTEVQVMNTKTSDELWIPRLLVGEVSRIEEPVMIVGLIKELEYKEGVVLPHRRRVIEMPRAVNDSVPPSPTVTSAPAPVIAIRLETDSGSRTRKLLRGSALGLLACVAVSFVIRDAHLGSRLGFAAVSRPLALTGQDDYDSVVRKLGTPAGDRWLRGPGDTEYRRLWYPRRGLVVILDRSAHYAGAVSPSGGIVDAAEPAVLQELFSSGWR